MLTQAEQDVLDERYMEALGCFTGLKACDLLVIIEQLAAMVVTLSRQTSTLPQYPRHITEYIPDVITSDHVSAMEFAANLTHRLHRQ